mmetsp:Transcript_15790/g.49649  ORF Transcript_15790/g.49649 Transcript_15790/m.49649 type:complete len:217 (-) Transcript_15790:817-1467(-)
MRKSSCSSARSDLPSSTSRVLASGSPASASNLAMSTDVRSRSASTCCGREAASGTRRTRCSSRRGALAGRSTADLTTVPAILGRAASKCGSESKDAWPVRTSRPPAGGSTQTSARPGSSRSASRRSQTLASGPAPWIAALHAPGSSRKCGGESGVSARSAISMPPPSGVSASPASRPRLRESCAKRPARSCALNLDAARCARSRPQSNARTWHGTR